MSERDKLHERWLESGSPSWSDWIYDEAASLRAALREAEAQRDAWREEGYLMVERVNADHERAETAERERDDWKANHAVVDAMLRERRIAAEQDRDAARQAHDDADAALQSLMAKYDPNDCKSAVAEYRQRAEALAEGWRWRKVAVEKEDDIALDMAEAQLDAAARDALSPLATLHGESSTASLRQAVQRVVERLEEPGWPHEYARDTHRSPCRACQILGDLRKAVAEPDRVEQPRQGHTCGGPPYGYASWCRACEPNTQQSEPGAEPEREGAERQ